MGAPSLSYNEITIMILKLQKNGHSMKIFKKNLIPRSGRGSSRKIKEKGKINARESI